MIYSLGSYAAKPALFGFLYGSIYTLFDLRNEDERPRYIDQQALPVQPAGLPNQRELRALRSEPSRAQAPYSGVLPEYPAPLRAVHCRPDGT